jgi:hypothetical protein
VFSDAENTHSDAVGTTIGVKNENSGGSGYGNRESAIGNRYVIIVITSLLAASDA